MQTIKYTTGRNYGAAQVLAITFTPIEDVMAKVEATFIDAARNISGTVTVYSIEAHDGYIGAAVLREYDAGRYAAQVLA